MKKAITLFAAILLLVVGATAQKLSYQAVVRNDANELVAETTVQVVVVVLDASNAVQYAETHANVQTNRNGLLSLIIGDGISMSSTTLADVEWPGASLRTVITLPDNTTITSVTPVNSVPYALYADHVDPNMVSNAIADYIANHSIGGEDNVQADWNETDQSSDAFIQNKPDIPTIPTNVSAFVNDAGYLTDAQCNGVDICSLLNMVAALQQQVDNVQDQNTNMQHRLDSLQTIVDTMNGIFVCGVSTVTDHEGNVYNTVKIGNQCWTKENLRTTKKPDGSDIALNSERYYPNGDTNNVAVYGYLYTWTAMMNGAASSSANPSGVQGICPTGWHVPSDAEWTKMTDYLSSQDIFYCDNNSSYIAKVLAATTGWENSTTTCAVGNDQSSNNATGFGALPAGGYYGSGYSEYSEFANFWSATENDNSTAYNCYLIMNHSSVYHNYWDKTNGYSVRCLRDSIPSGGDTPAPQDTTNTPVDTTTTDGQPCPGTPTVTDHEGNVYNTVKIGDQCWMKENLRTTTSPSTGTYLIPSASANYTFTGKQARWYNNDSATYAPLNYGLLYNWNAAVDTFNTSYGETSVNTSYSNAVSVTISGHRRGICPVGWHLPSNAEWNTMEAAVSGSDWQTGSDTGYYYYPGNLAGMLAGGDNWQSSTTSGAPGDYDNANRNVSGFSAVPAGYRDWLFNGAGYNAYFWSATQNGGSYAYYRTLYYGNVGVGRYNYAKYTGRSVRCLRDEPVGGDTPAPQDTTNTPVDTTTTDGQPCPGTPTVTDHEGNVYNTVQIGDQCWTKENLRTTTSPSTGTYLIPAVGTGWTITGKKAFWYNNDSATYAPMNYGLLYNWNAAVDTFNTAYGETSVNSPDDCVDCAVSVTFSSHRRGICPVGWHLPSNAEWRAMIDYVSSQSKYTCGGSSSNIAKALASPMGWSESTNCYAIYEYADDGVYYGDGIQTLVSCCPGGDQSVTANNASGFGAVPAGVWEGSFANAGYIAKFWSFTQDDPETDLAFYLVLGYDHAVVFLDGRLKSNGRSVRCLRDETGGGTTASLPTATTATVSDITTTTATCGGEVIADGGAEVIERGVCWSVSENPTTADNHTIDGTGLGTFTSNITNLTASTTYHVRAYATNSVGTVYGNEVSFTTIGGGIPQYGQPCPGTPTVTDHEGNVYNTVKIGDQCWMKENLRTTTSPSTGTYLIPAADTSYTYTGKQAFWYNNDSATYAPMNYGLLYNWNAAVDTFNTAYGETSVNTSESNAVPVTFSGHRRGICPVGWHLPSDAEWNTMEATVSGSDWQTSYETTYDWRGSHAGKLAGGDNWTSTTTSGAPGDYVNADRNVSGFSAVPAGHCYGSSFGNAGYDANFWSSSQSGYPFDAWYRDLYYDSAGVNRSGPNKFRGYSVRCLRD